MAKTKRLSKEQQTKIGKQLAELLMLKEIRQDRYNTKWGTKSALGLYLSIKRIIRDVTSGNYQF